MGDGKRDWINSLSGWRRGRSIQGRLSWEMGRGTGSTHCLAGGGEDQSKGDCNGRWEEGLDQLTVWLEEGKINPRETVMGDGKRDWINSLSGWRRGRSIQGRLSWEMGRGTGSTHCLAGGGEDQSKGDCHGRWEEGLDQLTVWLEEGKIN